MRTNIGVINNKATLQRIHLTYLHWRNFRTKQHQGSSSNYTTQATTTAVVSTVDYNTFSDRLRAKKDRAKTLFVNLTICFRRMTKCSKTGVRSLESRFQFSRWHELWLSLFSLYNQYADISIGSIHPRLAWTIAGRLYWLMQTEAHENLEFCGICSNTIQSDMGSLSCIINRTN